jgi:hypothetical protein
MDWDFYAQLFTDGRKEPTNVLRPSRAEPLSKHAYDARCLCVDCCKAELGLRKLIQVKG